VIQKIPKKSFFYWYCFLQLIKGETISRFCNEGCIDHLTRTTLSIDYSCKYNSLHKDNIWISNINRLTTFFASKFMIGVFRKTKMHLDFWILRTGVNHPTVGGYNFKNSQQIIKYQKPMIVFSVFKPNFFFFHQLKHVSKYTDMKPA
jgi:hypothetical protein